jgi:hypothetical protein
MPDFRTMPDLYRRNGCFSSFSRRSRARKCNSIEWDVRHVDIRLALNDNRTGYLDVYSEKKKEKERRKNAIHVEIYSGYFYTKCRALSHWKEYCVMLNIQLSRTEQASSNYSYAILFSVFRSSILWSSEGMTSNVTWYVAYNRILFGRYTLTIKATQM